MPSYRPTFRGWLTILGVSAVWLSLYLFLAACRPC